MSADSTALAVAQPVTYALAPPSFAMPRSIADIQTLSKMMVASGFFKDVKSEAQACVKIIAGSALGYDAVTALNAFHIIEGKITPTASEIGARVKRSGKYNYRVKSLDDAGCTLEFLERDGGAWMSLGDSTFTKQDAITAGLLGKSVWKSYFRNMAFSRALTNGVRWYCPDLFGGPVYTPEELGAAVDVRDGEMVVIEGEVVATPEAAPEARIPTAAEVRALYADALKADPSLPPDVKAWAAANVSGFDAAHPTKGMLVAIDAALRNLLAAGASVPVAAPEAPSTPSTPAPQPAAQSPGGGAVTENTRKHLMAALNRIGVTSKADRLAFAAKEGIDVRSYTELTETQGLRLAEVATNAARCPACGEIQPGAHLGGCPEGEAQL